MMQGLTSVLNRPTTLNLSPITNSPKSGKKFTFKNGVENQYDWESPSPEGLPKATLSPRLRRTHSLIVTRCPARSEAMAQYLRTRSLSTASTPSEEDTLATFERKHSAELLRTRLLEALQENKVLTHSVDKPVSNASKTTMPRSESYDSLLSPSYEQPMKVFKKLQLQHCQGEIRFDYGSCYAVRSAVSTLYNIDDFQMAKIGEGFFSEVFKVVHKSQGNVMVLKRNKHRAHRNSMLKEIQLMNTLDHENILRYEGACVHEGQLHALAEYVPGGSLDQLILRVSKEGAENELPWPLRVSLARDVAKGIEYLHSKGFFHRDLTSKNILIRVNECNLKPMTAVVADFGLAAKIPKSAEEHLPQVGSPYWMSPECLHGKFYNETADAFSFGIILCEMIALVEADPDFLPRTENFGVDYLAFSELVPAACPSGFLKIAFTCVSIDSNRPPFKDLNHQLGQLEDQIKAEEQVRKQKEKELKNKPKTPSPVYSTTPVKKGITLSRRCLSQRKPERSSPSELARLHKSVQPQKYTRTAMTETPSTIGEQMSKLDPFYIPSPATGLNPFAQLPRRLSAMGGGKIYGSKDLFYSCFELTDKLLPCHESPESPVLDLERSDSPLYRKAVSMINHEPLSTEDLIAEIETQVKTKS